MDVCELKYVEEGRWHFHRSVLVCRVKAAKMKFTGFMGHGHMFPVDSCLCHSRLWLMSGALQVNILARKFGVGESGLFVLRHTSIRLIRLKADYGTDMFLEAVSRVLFFVSHSFQIFKV